MLQTNLYERSNGIGFTHYVESSIPAQSVNHHKRTYGRVERLTGSPGEVSFSPCAFPNLQTHGKLELIIWRNRPIRAATVMERVHAE